MSRIAAILFLTTLIASAAHPTQTANSDDEFEGSVSVANNRIIVKAMRNTPAAGTRVRLMRGKRTVDEGTIDENGYWIGVADQIGIYEVWLGSSANDDEILKMPVTVAFVRSESDASWLPPCCRIPTRGAAVSTRPTPSTDRLPYFTGAIGIILLIGAAAILYSTRTVKHEGFKESPQ